MLNRWQFTTLTVLAAFTLAFVLVDIVLFTQNRTTQAEVTARAQYLQQTVQLQALYQELVKGLADLAVRNQDPALRDLLATQGITLNLPAASPPASAAQSPASVDSRKAPRK